LVAHTWSLEAAEKRFNEVVEAARSGPQTISQNGTPAVVMLDVAEYERLQRLERAQAPSFVDVLLTLPRDDSGQPRISAKPRGLDF
jgi:prevent-host-death family protein